VNSPVSHFGDAQRLVVADAFELHRLLQAIAGHIGLHFGDHVFHRFGNRRAVAVLAQAIDGVAHDQRRFGGVEDDDRLAARRAAHIDNRLRRGFGELVDIGARAGACAL
jgi:hypothetical protein